MITDEDPLRGLLFYEDLGFSHTLHVLKERRRRCEHLAGQSPHRDVCSVSTFEDSFCTEAGSYLILIDFLCHSTLGFRAF